MSKLLPLFLVLASTTVAHAKALAPLAADVGVETATITGPIPWCDGILVRDRWSEARIARAAATYDGMFAAAYQLCQRPHDATWKRTARNLLQRWINTAKQPQTDAIASIRVRLDPDRVDADLAALCSSMDRQSGLVRGISICPIEDNAPVELYLDRRGFTNELQRLYWVYKHLDGVASYVLLERELPISRAKLERDLSLSSFADNAYVRARVNEAVATIEWRKRTLEARIATDPDAAFMREIVDRAFLEWETLATTHHDDLATIAAVEQRLLRGTDLTGCSVELDDVLHRRLASYDARDDATLKRRIDTDPLSALILSRVAICHAADHIPDSALIRAIVHQVPLVAGPRSYAAYVLAKAVAKAGVKYKVVHPIAARNFFDYAPYPSRLAFTPDLAKGPRGVVSEVEPTKTGVRATLADGSTVEIPHRFATCVRPGVRLSLGKGGVVLFVSTATATPEVLAFLGYAL